MMHHHGTPITPRRILLQLAGCNFCVPWSDPRDVECCHEIGQSVLLDNGAYSIWRLGDEPDWEGYANWVRPWLEYKTTWAVMPDVIEGTEEENDELIVWLFAHHRDVWKRSAPVWHMHESITRLRRLCMGYDRVCVGSSGEYIPGQPNWHRRMDEAFDAIDGTDTWMHMLRAMDTVSVGPWPFASADSTNIARNWNRNGGAVPMVAQIDARQTPARWRQSSSQLTIDDVLALVEAD